MSTIIGIRVDATSYSEATKSILAWAKAGRSCFVCASNVHMLMETYDSPEFASIIKSADLVTPDGMPLVWMMRFKGQRGQERVYGPTLMFHVLDAATLEKLPVGFYGGKSEVLDLLVKRFQIHYPELIVPFVYSPPFRDGAQTEGEKVIQRINDSGVRILFVGLGCPKQEIWMSLHRNKIHAVMIGVGAAFDFHAGRVLQAPAWIQKYGLEWLFRLAVEPRRLWRRYLYHNPRFIILAIADLLGFLG